jgi:hypothetical protein
MNKLFTLEHRKAFAIFLGIFALAAMIFFTGCSASDGIRRTNPRWRQSHPKCDPARKEESGYTSSTRAPKIHMVKRQSY